MASTLVIYNPIAGRKRVALLWPQISQSLSAAGIEFDAVATRAPLDATELARSAAGKYTSVVGVGGDGTISEIVNGLMQASGESESMPFGIVPVGTGDDFAKMLPPEARIGSACYDWCSAIEKIARGDSRLYDVGRIVSSGGDDRAPMQYRYFVNIVDIGFGAHTVRNFASVPKFITGNTAYLAAVLKTMIDYPSLHVRMQFDDGCVFERTTTITAIGNGRCFGGGFWVCPDASPNDGLLDIMVAERVSRRTIFRLLPKLKRGTHVDQPMVSMSRARRVVLESDQPFLVEADGEMPVLPSRRLQVDILPNRLRVIV